jgi:hypothetical protein
MEAMLVFVALPAIACAAALIRSCRALNGPFFLYLSAAGIVLSCAACAATAS